MHAGERRLWLTVLALGLIDSARRGDESWLHSRDFEIVCGLAEVAPWRVRLRFEVDREHFRALRLYGRSN